MEIKRKSKPVRILVCDDHAITRVGLISVLNDQPNIKVIGQASDGDDAIEMALRLRPDIIIIDIFMPRCNGIDALAVIKRKAPSIKAVMLSISERDDHLFGALRLGAEGYISKNATVDEIIESVLQVAEGKVVYSPHLASRILSGYRRNDGYATLTGRELQVLRLLGTGLTDGEIAECLSIHESTVRTYLSRLMKKLRLGNRSELIAFTVQYQLENETFLSPADRPVSDERK